MNRRPFGARKPTQCLGWLPSLCVAAVLLGLAGCSKYGPETIRTHAKPPEMRTPEQIENDVLKAMGEIQKQIRTVNDAAGAKEAAPKVTDLFDRMKNLATEGISVERTLTADQNKHIEDQYKERMTQALASMMAAFADAQKIRGIPKEFNQAFLDGIKWMQKEAAEEKALLAGPPLTPPEVLPDNPPSASGWAVWFLCLLVLGACVAFLFRDGLWSNAIRLVNVVFAGLLAMNFYEWLATFLTNYSESLHPYVVMFDFLALWICFIFFLVLFLFATDKLSQVRVRFLKVVDQAGGIVLSVCIGWIMVGFTLVSLHAAPLAQYPLLGSFQPQNNMFFGMLAPDREWLGFTKYQSWGPYCRSVAQPQFQRCVFPDGFIETQLERRQHVENYISGNSDHAILVQQKFMQGPTKAAPKGSGG